MSIPPQRDELCSIPPPGVYIIYKRELEGLANRVRCAVPSLTMEQCYSSANAILMADIASQKEVVKRSQFLGPPYEPLVGECYD